jgi:hypothetical protein
MPRDKSDRVMRIIALVRRIRGVGSQQVMPQMPSSNGAGDTVATASMNGHGRWLPDFLSFRPLLDRGGPISISADADGPIATLARIDRNVREGRVGKHGLPEDTTLGPDSP